MFPSFSLNLIQIKNIEKHKNNVVNAINKHFWLFYKNASGITSSKNWLYQSFRKVYLYKWSFLLVQVYEHTNT